MAKKEKKAKKEQMAVEGETTIVEKKSLNVMLLIPLVAILAIAGSIVGTIITNKFIAPPVANGQGIEAQGSAKITEDQVITPMDEFLVNLAQGDKEKPEYIRITLSLLTGGEKDSAEITQNVAVIRDSIVNTLRQKSSTDILSGAEGVANLKTQLRDSINEAYGKSIIVEVFITDFVIQ
ncbi:MAG: flagellar basal body-associated FliL family protein [Enterococcus aquimarinus]|uniref:Flagellar protein FliL n=1 Tax=Enterococcus aquimarinus TaxID=328396 RepID=A0A9E3ZVR8_9ENTE|nr:flagellar basal body-associated FliL family protein [Enterococcus aquimarinus]